MKDEELLKQSEEWLVQIKGKYLHDEHNRDIANSFTQASIAASLLVIARNSLPTSESSGTDLKPMLKNMVQDIGRHEAPEPSVDDGKNHNTGEVFVKP